MQQRKGYLNSAGLSSSSEEDFGEEEKLASKESLVVPPLKTAAVEDGNNIVAAKKRRTVVTLNDSFLLAPSGLTSLKRDYFDSFQLASSSSSSSASGGGSGAELANLNKMFATYEKWLDNLTMRENGLPVFPKEAGSWPEFVDKLEKLKKVQIRKRMHEMRHGLVNTSSAPLPPLLPRFPPPPLPASSKPAAAAAATFSTAGPSTQMSEETKLLIQQKRESAMLRRKQLQQSSAALQTPTKSAQEGDGDLETPVIPLNFAAFASKRDEDSSARSEKVSTSQYHSSSQPSTLRLDDEDFEAKWQVQEMQQQQQQEEEEEEQAQAREQVSSEYSQAPTQRFENSQASTLPLDRDAA